jgi:hypothetical protein
VPLKVFWVYINETWYDEHTACTNAQKLRNSILAPLSTTVEIHPL